MVEYTQTEIRSRVQNFTAEVAQITLTEEQIKAAIREMYRHYFDDPEGFDIDIDVDDCSGNISATIRAYREIKEPR